MKPKPGRPAYEPDEKTRAQVKMLAAMGIPKGEIYISPSEIFALRR